MDRKVYNLIVIGGGTTGISALYEASLYNFTNIALFEKENSLLTTINKYYKKFKRVDKNWKGQKIDILGNINFQDSIKEETINLFQTSFNQISDKIDTFFNTEIEQVKKENNIFQILTTKGEIFYSKNVIIAIGIMGRPNKPNYKLPTSLKKVINFDINNCKQDEKILVVGGGNSAVEYACAVSEFANVTLSYRGGELKRVNNENIQNLLKLSENNKILLKMAIDIEFIENYRGRIKVYFQHGEIKIYDRVVYAIGGTTPINLLKKCGFLLKKLPVYDTNFMSHIKGLYIAGDVAVNGGSIALGLNHSYTIINHIKQKNIF